MIKDNLVYNQQAKPNSRYIEKLRADFPEFFNKDGEFQLRQFQELLASNDINVDKEGFELRFLGKSYARYLSSSKTETFLSPDTRHNSAEQNILSSNIYIYGDNLDALKHLLGSYASKIKCIYIDPPYNTGNDGFVYPDNFSFTVDSLAKAISISEEEAERLLNLKGKSSHSAWLTFMYPRLLLARELLTEDGSIFISIDDNEHSNLKTICDEIFGEENFVADVIWKRKRGRDNSAKWFSKAHEYCLIYSKNKSEFKTNYLKLNEETIKAYKNPDNDKRGPYRMLGCWARGTQGGVKYSFTTKNGNYFKERLWLFSKENLTKLDEEDKLIIRGDNIYRKMFIYENKGQIPETLWDDVSNAANASDEIKSLFGDIVFDTPKPIPYIKRMLEIATNNNDIILDFFSGSATLAHAVLQLNSEKNENRKFILVQIAENIPKDKVAYSHGFRTIDEVGRKRIELAAQKIKSEIGANIDYGYKLFSLEDINQNHLSKLQYFESNKLLQLDNLVDIFQTDHSSGKDSILTTWMVQDGYGLTTPVLDYQLHNYTANKVQDTLYLISDGLTSDDLMICIQDLETAKLDITRIVVYANSIDFNITLELKNNLKQLKNNKVELIERY